ncbi:autophagy-related protein 13b [Cryptomeria japonica]|uniref:autophagy-related protein 13b n=1 Tax=Cryptomeria japonica TaxID=3369 RepID=UPI0027DA6FDC|nr:autophagy-related protein 13b [Cryptomeria japonica]XP_057821877.2 autophagy-related protein 13b [Cryptomeria japonica]
MGEPEKIQPIIFEFFRKVVQVILESRIQSVSRSASSKVKYSQCSSPTRDRDKWFYLNLGLTDNAKLPILEPWSKTPTTEPMFVEILLAGSDGASIARPGGQSSRGFILERWTVQYALNASSSALHADMERSVLYNKAVSLLRSLCCTTKLLPAYRVFKYLQKSPPSHNTRKLTYRISANPMTLPKGIMKNDNFIPVETQCGKLCLSVSYFANLFCRSGSEVDRLETPITQLIPDYCGSPGSDRRFHGTSRGKHNVLSAPSSPGFKTTGFGRCHSWSGGINKILLPSTAPQQSPSHRFSMIPTGPNPNYHGTLINSRTPPLPVPPQRSHSIVDHFASPSPSPPMRSRLSNESVSRGLLRTGSLPQNMDQSRNTLPHHSNWTREAHALSRAVSANSKFIPVYSHSALSSTSTSGNSVVPRQAHSGHKDERDDNVSLRRTLSRGSSRCSYTNEAEDEDLSCLFALDGDESDGYRSRADSLDGKLRIQEVMEGPGQTVSAPRRSQNAALGELVEMLKSATPLQQYSRNALDFSQASADKWRSDSSKETFQCQSNENQCGVTSSSTVYSNRSRFSCKTAADALNELRNYMEIKDCLLRQSGVPKGRCL